jgi:C4-dicarboxylate transporter DctM subunit
VIAILLVTFLILLVLGVPVAFSGAIASILAILMASDLPTVLVLQRIYNTLNSFSLMAVPLFILTGQLMNSGGITRRIINLAKVFVGKIRGGLSHVNVVASMVFAGISGSATADSAGIGAILIPSMIKEGYEEDWAVGITAASSTVGPIIPPSVLMIVYASITQLSVGRLFLAGLFPGVFIGLSLLVVGYVLAVRRHRKRSDYTLTRSDLFRSILEGWPTLLAPLIIIGGVTSGVFTATESGAIAALYALILGILYKELTFETFHKTLLETAKHTTIILFLVGCAATFGWVMAHQNVPQDLMHFITSVTSNNNIILLLILILVLITGTIVDGLAIILVFVPVFFPLTRNLGFDPYHFAAVFIVAVMIGAITPPVGILLYISCSVGGVSIRKTMPLIWVFVGAMTAILFFVAYVPVVSTYLPYALIK